jgi:hypothetical protein
MDLFIYAVFKNFDISVLYNVDDVMINKKIIGQDMDGIVYVPL